MSGSSARGPIRQTPRAVPSLPPAPERPCPAVPTLRQTRRGDSCRSTPPAGPAAHPAAGPPRREPRRPRVAAKRLGFPGGEPTEDTAAFDFHPLGDLVRVPGRVGSRSARVTEDMQPASGNPSTSSYVERKASASSPGNPTMTSPVTAIIGAAAASRSTSARNSAAVCPRRMRRRTPSSPLCSGRWRWRQNRGESREQANQFRRDLVRVQRAQPHPRGRRAAPRSRRRARSASCGGSGRARRFPDESPSTPLPETPPRADERWRPGRAAGCWLRLGPRTAGTMQKLQP